MKEIEMKMKKVSYAFLLKHGVFTTGKWSYYGGSYDPLLPPDVKGNFTSYKNLQKFYDDIKSEIKTVGIDWDKTQIPETESNNVFDGTFAENNRYTECTLGTLVLKNGKMYTIGATTSLPFGEHMKDLFALMKLVEESDTVFED